MQYRTSEYKRVLKQYEALLKDAFWAGYNTAAAHIPHPPINKREQLRRGKLLEAAWERWLTQVRDC